MCASTARVCAGWEIKFLNTRDRIPLYVTAIAYTIYCFVPIWSMLVEDDTAVNDTYIIFVIILVSDVFQYIGGHALEINNYRPFPALSPRKTLGGYLTSMCVGSWVFAWFATSACITPGAGWSVIACMLVIVVGILGDLAVSDSQPCWHCNSGGGVCVCVVVGSCN